VKAIEAGIDLRTERQRDARGRRRERRAMGSRGRGGRGVRAGANHRADETFQRRTGIKGGTLRSSIAVVAGALALATATPANAELGEPFAEATVECFGYVTTPEGGSYVPGAQHTGSGPVSEGHVFPLVLVDGTPGGNADFQHSTGETGVWETYWLEAVSFFREHHKIEPGWQPTVGTDCGASYTPYKIRARWYDRPSQLPATFSATGSSVIGFQAQEAGRYVADVVPPGPGFEVAIRTHCTGEYCDPEWHEDVNRSATFDRPGRLRLGRLSAGPHNLVVADGAQSHVRSTGAWQVTIRRARPRIPPLPEPPVVEGPPLADPPAGDNGDPRPRVVPPLPPAPPPRPEVMVGPDGPRVSGDRSPPRYRLTGSRRGRRLRLVLRVYETATVTVRLESGRRKTTIRRQLARNRALVVRRTTPTRRARILVRLVDRAGNTRRVARTY
jgi:hypothetical protein